MQLFTAKDFTVPFPGTAVVGIPRPLNPNDVFQRSLDAFLTSSAATPPPFYKIADTEIYSPYVNMLAAALADMGIRARPGIYLPSPSRYVLMGQQSGNLCRKLTPAQREKLPKPPKVPLRWLLEKVATPANENTLDLFELADLMKMDLGEEVFGRWAAEFRPLRNALR